MCGISGGIGPRTYEAVEDSLSSLKRRGPDSQNLHRFPNGLTLGAARLAMTDPHPRSNQPFLNLETGNALVFNGEIYNFKILRSELQEKGIEFITDSDTEVVLKCLEFYGTEIIAKLEGMFAFAFFDSMKNELVLSRDFLGKKPLYFSTKNSSIFFSSQISVIKKFINAKEIDNRSLSTYLQLGYLLDPFTMYSDISAVQAGEVIKIDLSKKIIHSKYVAAPLKLGSTPGRCIRDVLENSIVQRVAGHDSFAISLSGGIDSTIISVVANALGLNPIAFTARWSSADKTKYNIDSKLASEIANRLEMPLRVIEMPEAKEITENLRDFVIAMEEPNANPTGVSMMRLYESIAKEGLRLVLTGDGSDEIFGGYSRHEKVNKLKYFPQLDSNCLEKFMKNNQEKTKLIKILYPFINANKEYAWLFWHLISNKKELAALFQQTMPMPEIATTIDLKELYNSKRNRVANLMFNDLQLWLNMESNRKLDRVSMWHSIEARSPFQSEELINTGYIEMKKLKFGTLKKELLKKEFPELSQLVTSREKIGFSSPIGHWLRSNPKLIKRTGELLIDEFRIDAKSWNALAKAPAKRDFHGITQLWSLVVLGTWVEHAK